MITPPNTRTIVRNGRCDFTTSSGAQFVIRKVDGYWRVAEGVEHVGPGVRLMDRQLGKLLFDLDAGAVRAEDMRRAA